MKRLLCSLIVCVIVAATSAAHAQRSSESQARSFFERGVVHVERGELASAVEAFERSLAAHPRASTAYNLAVVLVELGRIDDARVLIARALELGPSNEDHRNIEALLASLPSVPPPVEAEVISSETDEVGMQEPIEDTNVAEVAIPEVPPPRVIAIEAQRAPDLLDQPPSTRRRGRRIALTTAGGVALIATIVSVVVVRTNNGSPYVGMGVF